MQTSCISLFNWYFEFETWFVILYKALTVFIDFVWQMHIYNTITFIKTIDTLSLRVSMWQNSN